MNVIVTEGARIDGHYVLTPDELRRVVHRETRALRSEVARLKDMHRKLRARRDARPIYVPQSEHAEEKRRETYRNANAVRYQRYRVLCRYYGEPQQPKAWARHLSELDRRFAANPPRFTPAIQDTPLARELLLPEEQAA